MKRIAALITAFALGFAPSARAAETVDQPVLRQIAGAVKETELRATIVKLVGFGTRHTLSDTKSKTRGIGAARRWVESRFKLYSGACGGCIAIATPSAIVSGKRVPTPTEVVDVLAIQRGVSDPGRVIIISAHLDSRITDVMDFKSDAPGANDDGSGVAAVLEAARILSKHKFAATLVYAIDSGEEQDLYGGKILADYAKAQGWRVEAALNNDIVGNIHGANGTVERSRVRVFSEGVKMTETPAQAAARQSTGGEVDSPSRNLARFMDRLADQYLKGFDVEMIYRTDRFGRGGDQIRMLEAGFPAIRVTEAVEDYDREHQTPRTEGGKFYGDTIEGIDFPYLANVTRLNVISMAALASAPAPPLNLKIEGAVTADTKLSWAPPPGAAYYEVWRRGTTEPQWRDSWITRETSITLKGITIDDSFFGVSSVSADGFASPIEFPGAGGAFVSTAP